MSRKTGAAVGIGLAGAVLWAWFVRWGAELGHMDYTRTRFYTTTILDALQTWKLPLYYPAGIDSEWVNFYWAHPDTSLMPGLILLRFLSPGPFQLCVSLWWFLVGWAGAWWLARSMGLGVEATVLLLIVLLIPGPLIAHLSVGQHWWHGYSLLPWILGDAWLLANARASASTSLRLGGALALQIVSGSPHFALWSCAFLVMFGALTWHAIPTLVLAACWMVVLAGIRLVPLFTVFPIEVLRHFPFMGGYDWTLFWTALTLGMPGIVKIRPWMWEYDLYLGYAGPALLIIGLIGPLRCARMWRSHLRLIVPASAFVWLSWGAHWAWYPWLSLDRAPTRALILPLVVLLMQAVWTLDRLRWRWLTATFGGALGVSLVSYMIAHRPPPGALWDMTRFPIPSVPSGAAWGTLPLALPHPLSPPAGAWGGLEFSDIYRRAILIGVTATCIGLVFAGREVWSRWSDDARAH